MEGGDAIWARAIGIEHDSLLQMTGNTDMLEMIDI